MEGNEDHEPPAQPVENVGHGPGTSDNDSPGNQPGTGQSNSGGPTESNKKQRDDVPADDNDESKTATIYLLLINGANAMRFKTDDDRLKAILEQRISYDEMERVTARSEAEAQAKMKAHNDAIRAAKSNNTTVKTTANKSKCPRFT